MDRGKLRNRIAIEQEALSAPSAFSGERTKSWSTSATLNAHVKPLKGRELAFAKSFAPTVSHRITMPFIPDVENTNRITATIGGQTFLFHINSIKNGLESTRRADYRNIWLTIYCTGYTDGSNADIAGTFNSDFNPDFLGGGLQ